MTKTTITGGTIARTVILLLALINQCLSMAGIPILPIEDAQVGDHHHDLLDCDCCADRLVEE